jgi:hypothetical protein
MMNPKPHLTELLDICASCPPPTNLGVRMRVCRLIPKHPPPRRNRGDTLRATSSNESFSGQSFPTLTLDDPTLVRMRPSPRRKSDKMYELDETSVTSCQGTPKTITSEAAQDRDSTDPAQVKRIVQNTSKSNFLIHHTSLSWP